jgi:hypothetical protein
MRFTDQNALELYGKEDVGIHVFLISALVGSKSSVSRPGRFNLRKTAPGTHWKGG